MDKNLELSVLEALEELGDQPSGEMIAVENKEIMILSPLFEYIKEQFPQAKFYSCNKMTLEAWKEVEENVYLGGSNKVIRFVVMSSENYVEKLREKMRGSNH